jgi:acyl-CoA dehydrogenase
MPDGLIEVKKLTEQHSPIVQSVEQLCSKYDDNYCRELDEKKAYPEEFMKSMERLGLAAL